MAGSVGGNASHVEEELVSHILQLEQYMFVTIVTGLRRMELKIVSHMQCRKKCCFKEMVLSPFFFFKKKDAVLFLRRSTGSNV